METFVVRWKKKRSVSILIEGRREVFEFCLYKNAEQMHTTLRNTEEQTRVFNFISSVTISYLYNVTNCLLQQVRLVLNRLFLVTR